MDFSLSKEQAMLQKSAKDFLNKECKEMAREAEETREGYFPKTWGKMAELGWTGIGIPESYEGLGGDFFDLIILLEEMGRALLPGPFISSSICAAQAILAYGNDEQKKKFLTKMSYGDLLVMPAFFQPDDFAGKTTVTEKLEKKGEQYLISGTRLFVAYGHMADWFIYKAIDNSGAPLLFLVDTKSKGIEVNVLDSIASDKQCEIILDKVAVPAENILGNINQQSNIINLIERLGATASCAYLLGSLEQVLEMTVNYAKERVQFDKFIGSFQAIQHQCADMYADVEQVKYLTYQAGWLLSKGEDAVMQIAMAKARASDASRRVNFLGVKIHGGIGIIDEYDLQLHFRRAKAGELAYGDAKYHREIIAQQMEL